MSLLTPEALGLIDRVEQARALFRDEGLSAPGANLLIGLGCWRPMDLLWQSWEDGPDRPGLGSRIATSPGCDPELLEELRAVCRQYEWPE